TRSRLLHYTTLFRSRFSIGFGKPIWTWIAGRDRTEYCISALPLGGYVKFLDEREGPVEPADEGRAFNHRPVPARTAVLFAGPFKIGRAHVCTPVTAK